MAGFYQQRLFRNSFICVASASRRAVSEPPTLKKFLEAPHAVVSPEGRTHDLFERELKKRGCVRRVRLEIPHYLSLPAIIEASDLVATVPRDVGVAFARHAKLRLLEPPVNVSFDVKQYWHERAHKDPVNLWLREMVHSLFHHSGAATGASPLMRAAAVDLRVIGLVSLDTRTTIDRRTGTRRAKPHYPTRGIMRPAEERCVPRNGGIRLSEINGARIGNDAGACFWGPAI